MQPRVILILLLGFIVLPGWAQSKKKKSKKKEHSSYVQSSGPTSLAPSPSLSRDLEADYSAHSRKSKKKGHFGPSYNAEERYYMRLKEVAKERTKLAKELKKPQHSDPAYFGHKHLPKKHKPKKMRYCNVCGIRH